MYQAPEVLQKAGVGTPADVFSFGIIMWEMISGEIPYEVGCQIGASFVCRIF